MFRDPVKFRKPYEIPILKSIKVTGYFHTWLELSCGFENKVMQCEGSWMPFSWSPGFWGAEWGKALTSATLFCMGLCSGGWSYRPSGPQRPIGLCHVWKTLLSKGALMLKFSFLGSILHCFGVWKLFPAWTGVVLRNFSISFSRTFGVFQLQVGPARWPGLDLLSLFLVSLLMGRSYGEHEIHLEGDHVTSRLPWYLGGKESGCNAEDASSVPGLGRSPGEGNGNPLHYSCLGNPVGWETQQATVSGVTESETT